MTMTTSAPTANLTPGQLRDYERDGFLLLKGHMPEADIERVERGFQRNPPLDGTLDPNRPEYPNPGRYTLAQSCLKDPDLGFLAEHAGITTPAADVLGGDPRLTAYVIYDRTPEGPGLPMHNDYKRWRPVGSSMNWVFTIVPFCDFDAAAGRLYVVPGSHHIERVTPGSERPLEVAAPVMPNEADLIDPGLERGDLLLMNMFLWHKADANHSDHHRVGAFNKYASADAPPATGYFLFDDDVPAALAPENRSLIATHSNKPLATTRLVLTRADDERDPQILLTNRADGKLQLPGGPTFIEQAIPDWDRGNVVASLQASLRQQIRIETPWVSWVGDFDEGDHLCRTYAYTLTGLGFPVPYSEGRWLSRSQLANARADGDLAHGYEVEALDRWLDPTVVRGKALTQAQSRVNQYAY